VSQGRLLGLPSGANALIRSLKDKETERLFHDYRVRRFPRVETVARRKLKMLDDAISLEDVAALPGHRGILRHG
jgi:plasmid maintenance system killer protein